MSHRPLPACKILVYERDSHPTLCILEEILDIIMFHRSHFVLALASYKSSLNQIELSKGECDHLIILGICNTIAHLYVYI